MIDNGLLSGWHEQPTTLVEMNGWPGPNQSTFLDISACPADSNTIIVAARGPTNVRFQPYSRPTDLSQPASARFRVQHSLPTPPAATVPAPWQAPVMMQLPAPQYHGPPPGALILKLPLAHEGKKDCTRSWSDIVHQWRHGWPERNIIPLCQWPREWLIGVNKPIYGALYNQRKVIALEFIETYVPCNHFWLVPVPIGCLQVRRQRNRLQIPLRYVEQGPYRIIQSHPGCTS